jgi:hypothetical protein
MITLYMTKSILKFITIFSIISILTACAELNNLLSLNAIPGPETQDSVALASPTSIPSTPTLPTATAAPQQTPTETQPSKPTRTPRPTQTPTATLPPIVRVGPDNFPSYINPLTGLVAYNPLALERRPIAVKIPNAPHSVRKQQFGISLADHVWEYHLEWGLTRFIAIFYGNDAIKVGPIRSGRIFDAHVMDMYNAILVYNGADPRVLDHFDAIGQSFNLMVVERECPPLCRDDNFPPPKNLFGNTTQIHEYVRRNGTDDSRYDQATNFFYSLGGRGGDRVQRVFIYYSYASYSYWDYDLNSNRYIRYQGNTDLSSEEGETYQLLTDRLTGKTIMADNVIILFAPHAFFHKSSDTEVFTVDMNGEGPAYVFNNGKVQEAVWKRTEKYKPLSILNLDGTPFPLRPGVTFFQVIHSTSQLEKNDNFWTFIFERPIAPN